MTESPEISHPHTSSACLFNVFTSSSFIFDSGHITSRDDPEYAVLGDDALSQKSQVPKELLSCSCCPSTRSSSAASKAASAQGELESEGGGVRAGVVCGDDALE